MGQLDGRCALITGASRGIGRAVADLFAREGARVALCARNSADLAEVIANLPGRGHLSIPTDLASDTQVEALAAEVKFWCGRHLHILVNNASALGPIRPSEEIPQREFEEVLRINTASLFQLTSLLIPVLAEGASVINVSSTVGRNGRAHWAAYAASKAAVENLSQTWAEELAPRGIRVNAVNPGGTRTRMRATALPDEDPSTLPTPEDIAPIFLWLAGEDSAGVTGQSLDARGWNPPN